jgi:CRISPR/Cas system-associated exonuclease Cas4 (RecB family)
LEFDLNALIDDRRNDGVKKTREIGHFWASEFGKCHRQFYYMYTQEREFQPERKRIFMVGNLVHEHIQHLLKARENKDFRLVFNEKGVTIRDDQSPVYITGRVDTLIVPFQNDPYILEFKSVGEAAFRKKVQIQLSHKYQTMLYMHAENLKRGFVVYVNKNDMQVKVFELPYDEEVFNRIMGDARYLYRCLLDKVLPPNKPKFGWECNLCIFSDICKQHETDLLKRRLFPNRTFDSGSGSSSNKEEVKPDGLRSEGNQEDDISGVDEGDDIHDQPEG